MATVKELHCVPAHHGFNQLAIYLEKDKQYGEAIKLSEQELEQGWNGDWQHRIGRCRAKMK